MKYMLLMQFSKDSGIPELGTWAEEEVRGHIDFMHRTNTGLTKNGELVDAQGLAGPETAKIVRAAGEAPAAVTEGPFPETKEWVAGWWIVDVEDEARALAIAAEVSTAPGPGGRPLNMPIEVRQVLSAPPSDL